MTIARNLVSDHHRSFRTRREVPSDGEIATAEVAESAEQTALRNQLRADLSEALTRLTPSQQKCVFLRFYCGFSVPRTANALGSNPGAVRALQYRAIRALAVILAEQRSPSDSLRAPARCRMKETVMALAPGIGAALVDIVGGDHVCFDVAVRRRYGRWLTEVFYAVPDAVVLPARTGEVSELMRGAAACGVPIVHRSLAPGSARAVLLGAGWIVLSLERMNRIVDVDLVGGVARIQPYVTGEQLRFATELDLSGPAEVSGLAAEDSHTSQCAILDAEAVLPRGEIVRTGDRLPTRDQRLAAPLDGPDGTMAVITEFTICLDPSRASSQFGLIGR